MPDATTTNLGADADQHPEQTPPQLPSTKHICTSCQITFRNGQEQRVHMKEPWHVYNIKRRIASLPPIPLEVFNTQILKRLEINETHASSKSSSGSDEEASDNDSEKSSSPFQCLFCNQDFGEDDQGFDANLEHMRIAHGLTIPDPEMIIEMQSFVGYLATEVRVWHECLYCGATKQSIESIQSHMRDKGHCSLNFDREPELLDFWDRPQSDKEDGAEDVAGQESPTHLSSTEMRFASGKVIGSRQASHTTKKASRKRALAASTLKTLPSGSEDEAESSRTPVEPQQTSSRQLARREEMGIVGISAQQRQALVLAEKKAQRSETVARRAREWAYAKGANSQKYDQLDGSGKWGKQQHKLLPR